MLTDRPEDRFRVGSVLFREGEREPLTIERAEPVANGPGWWLRFGTVNDRTAAEGLRGAYLEAEVAADHRPAEAVW